MPPIIPAAAGMKFILFIKLTGLNSPVYSEIPHHTKRIKTTEAHIPDNYIENLAGRLDAYRKIAAVSTKEESIDLLDEFIDRYGDPPKAIQGLVTVALTRNMAGKAGITEITQRSNALLIYVKTAGMEQVQALVKAFGGRVSVNGSADKPYIAIKLTKTDRPVEIMQTAVETFYEAGEQAKKTK